MNPNGWLSPDGVYHSSPSSYWHNDEADGLCVALGLTHTNYHHNCHAVDTGRKVLLSNGWVWVGENGDDIGFEANGIMTKLDLIRGLLRANDITSDSNYDIWLNDTLSHTSKTVSCSQLFSW